MATGTDTDAAAGIPVVACISAGTEATASRQESFEQNKFRQLPAVLFRNKCQVLRLNVPRKKPQAVMQHQH